MTEITVLTNLPDDASTQEVTIEELAKRLGLPEDDLGAVLERLGKNLTVGDVHVATSLKDVSVAYLQGEEEDEDDGEQEEEAESEAERIREDRFAEARKANRNRADGGKYGPGSDAGAGRHLGALYAADTNQQRFDDAHAALAGDPKITLGHLKSIAARYHGGKTFGSKATRADVLQGIKDAHAEHCANCVTGVSKEEQRDEHGRWIGGGESQEHAEFLSEASNKLSELQSQMEEHQANQEEIESRDDEVGQEHGYDSKEYAQFEKDVKEAGAKAAKTAEAVHEHLKSMLAAHENMMRAHDLIKRREHERGLDVRFDFAIQKADPDQKKVFGWASVSAVDGVPVVDKQEDIIPIHELEKAAHDFTLYSRTQGDMHTDIGVGRLIESVVIDADKRAAGLVAKDEQGREIDGWWVGFKVDDDDVWAAHKRGDRLEFSIGGRAQREPVEKAWSDEARAAAAEARTRAAKNRELATQHPGQAGLHNEAAQAFEQAAQHFENSLAGGGRASFKQGQEHMAQGREHVGVARQMRSVHGIF